MSKFERLELKSEKPGDQLLEILHYYKEDHLQIKVKNSSFTATFTFSNTRFGHYEGFIDISNIRFSQHEGFIHIEDENKSMDLYKGDIKQVREVFSLEEITWKKAGYTIELRDETLLSIDVLK